MLFTLSNGLMAALLAGSAAAHMQMDFPAPFRSKFNPHATNIDYSMTAPLNADGSNYPCKGYHSDLGTAAGAPTASFAPGQTYNVSITGGANHGGGSCQISLSYDKGQSFVVIESIEGGCPTQPNYDFTVPSDAQTGEAILAWSWHNRIGNREMYMNCAAVTIGSGSAKRDNSVAQLKPRAEAFTARPQIFIANIGNGCSVDEGIDVQYPNPGPDVIGTGGTAPPKGNCAAAAAGGGDGGNGGGAPSPTTVPVAPVPEPTTDAPAAPAPTSEEAAPSVTLPGGVFHTIPSDSAPSPTEAAPSAGFTAEPAPTTLQTSTKAGTATLPTGTGSADPGSGSDAGTFAAGTTCEPEGEWNCIAGTSYQRCASGAWSAVMPMAPGTKCSPSGLSDTLGIAAARRSRVVRARKW